MTNTRDGNYLTTPENMMRAFDKPPPTARRALANALEDWVPKPLLTRHRQGRRGYATGADIAATVARWDAQEAEKRDQDRLRAVGAYKGNVPTVVSPRRGAKRRGAQ